MSLARTLLVEACGRGDEEVVFEELERGAKVNASSENPLSVALECSSPQQRVAELLIQCGAAPIPVLASAVARGDIRTAEFLLESGITVSGLRLLNVACLGQVVKRPDLEMAALLLMFSRKRWPSLFEIAEHALESRNLELLEFVMSAGFHVERPRVFFSRQNSALQHALLHGFVESVELLLEVGAGPLVTTSELEKALSLLTSAARRDLTLSLSTWGSTVPTCLRRAAVCESDLDLCQFIAQASGTLVPSRDAKLMQELFRIGRETCLEFALLADACPVGGPLNTSSRLLRLAIASNNLLALEMILIGGVTPDPSVFMEAIGLLQIDCMQLLLGAGADPNLTLEAITPLQRLMQVRAFAARRSASKLLRAAELLLEHGADASSFIVVAQWPRSGDRAEWLHNEWPFRALLLSHGARTSSMSLAKLPSCCATVTDSSFWL